MICDICLKRIANRISKCDCLLIKTPKTLAIVHKINVIDNWTYKRSSNIVHFLLCHGKPSAREGVLGLGASIQPVSSYTLLFLSNVVVEPVWRF